MKTICTDYIDLHDEHRIYFIDGTFCEICGMLAVSEIISEAAGVSNTTTHYKLIQTSNMHPLGFFPENDMPTPIGYRGGEVPFVDVIRIIMTDFVSGFDIADGVRNIFADMKRVGLKTYYPEHTLGEVPENIIVYLFPTEYGYRVSSSLFSSPLFGISESNSEDIRISDFLDFTTTRRISIKNLAYDIGEIIAALQKYFKNPSINLSSIILRHDEGFLAEKLKEDPKFFEKFLRMVNIGVEFYKD